MAKSLADLPHCCVRPLAELPARLGDWLVAAAPQSPSFISVGGVDCLISGRKAAALVVKMSAPRAFTSQDNPLPSWWAPVTGPGPAPSAQRRPQVSPGPLGGTPLRGTPSKSQRSKSAGGPHCSAPSRLPQQQVDTSELYRRAWLPSPTPSPAPLRPALLGT